MAILAHADQVPLLLAIFVDKEPAQGQLRPAFNMIDMVNKFRSAVFSPGLAQLALVSIFPENICAKVPPLRCDVERMNITCCDQLQQPM